MCDICNKNGSNDDLGGIRSKGKITVHYFCVLLATGLPQKGRDRDGILGFLIKDIRSLISLTRDKKCCYCNEIGASVKCSSCPVYFHVLCGMERKCRFRFIGEFNSFCHLHHNITHSKQHSNDYLCFVCLEEMGEYHPISSIMPKCCNSGWMHLSCVKKYAFNAGYYLTCILCASPDFRDEARELGIFVPDRDAIWEMEKGAYADLHTLYPRCDAEECLCPSGRKYANNKRWKIIVCSTCGASGTHSNCSKHKLSIENKWLCKDCEDQSSELSRSFIEYIKQSSFERFSQSQSNSSDDTLQPNGKQHTKDKSPNTGREIEGAYANLHTLYSRCDAEECLCPSGRKYANNKRWKIIVCSTCGASGTHSNCSKHKLSIENKWLCKDCEDQSSELSRSFIEYIKQSSFERFSQSQSNSSDDTLQPNGKQHTKDKSPNTGREIEGAYANLHTLYSRCDAEECLCPSGRKYANNKRWKIIVCSTCGASGTHSNCSKHKLSIENKWLCKDCEDQSSELSRSFIEYIKQSSFERFSQSQSNSSDDTLQPNGKQHTKDKSPNTGREIEGAYANLHTLYSRCDAEECLCPRGRKYANNKRWKIIVCSTCGASGTHSNCSKHKLSIENKWLCKDCEDQSSELSRSFIEYIKQSSFERFSQSQSNSSDDTLQPNGKQHTKDKSPNTGREIEGAYANLHTLYSRCDAEECLCPSGRKYANNKRWKIIVCSTCGASGTHSNCSKHKLSIENKWLCKDCEDQSSELSRSFIEYIKQSSFERFSQSQSNSSDDTLQPNGKQHTKDKSPNTGREIEGAYANLHTLYSRCDAEECLCPSGRKYANNKRWKIIVCSTCGASGTHSNCSKHKLSIENKWLCKDCEDQSSELSRSFIEYIKQSSFERFSQSQSNSSDDTLQPNGKQHTKDKSPNTGREIEGAYAGLHTLYSRCDAEECLCPRGRKYANNKRWKIIVCSTCGASGTHSNCSKHKLSIENKWLCKDCEDQSSELSRSFIEYIKQSSFERFSQSQSNSSDDTLQPNGKQHTKDKSPNTGREIEGAYANLHTLYSRCDAEECLCPSGRKYANNKRWKIIVCSTCGASGTHSNCSKHKLSIENKWLCKDCEDQSSELSRSFIEYIKQSSFERFSQSQSNSSDDTLQPNGKQHTKDKATNTDREIEVSHSHIPKNINTDPAEPVLKMEMIVYDGTREISRVDIDELIEIVMDPNFVDDDEPIDLSPLDNISDPIVHVKEISAETTLHTFYDSTQDVAHEYVIKNNFDIDDMIDSVMQLDLEESRSRRISGSHNDTDVSELFKKM